MSPLSQVLGGALSRTREVFDDALFRFAAEHQHAAVKRVSTNALLLWVALYTLSLLPRHAVFWGADAPVVRPFDPNDWTHWITHLANAPGADGFYLAFVFAQLTAVCLALVNVRRPLMLLVVLWTTWNLHHRCFFIADGGNNVVWLLLPLTAAMAWGEDARGGMLGDVRRSLSNAALSLARFQIVVMYGTAGLCKVIGEQWQNGTALFHILQVREYANPAIAPYLIELWPLTVLGTYLTIGFQLTFPFAMLSRRLRFVSMAAGVFLHLNIAVVMGLPAFGLIMCISYLFFLREPEAWRVRRWFAPDPVSTIVFIDPQRLGGRLARWLATRVDDASTVVVQPGHPPDADGTAAALDILLAHTPLRWLRPATSLLYVLGFGRLLHGASLERTKVPSK